MWIDTVLSIGKVVVLALTAYALFLGFFSRLNAEERPGAMMGSLIVVALLWAIALGARAILLALKRRRR